MKKLITATVFIILTFLLIVNVYAESFKDKQQTTESLVKLAAETVAKNGIASAMFDISQKDGDFCNRDTYVYMMNMDAVIMAHPYAHSLIGINLSGSFLKDKNGKERPMMLVNFAKEKGSGWISYLWPKPNEKKESEKFCYIYKIKDANLFLAAGIYKD